MQKRLSLIKTLFLALAVPAAVGLAAPASAQSLRMAPNFSSASDTFVVRDLRVIGLQRISEGTVYNYLPVNIGDEMTPQRLGEAFRALYAQGFFDEMEFRRDGDTLVLVVRERPAIAAFNISGNEDIETEDLLESMRGVGLSPGRSFDRSVLDSVAQFLTQQYFEQGKYGVAVETSVTDLPDNKVSVRVEIEEGSRARIRQINIVGNEVFTDEELLEEFQLRTPNWLSWLRKDDRYAREALAGDLETLQSYYMDRGYAAFNVSSTQVAISSDKQDMFITINVEEGGQYTISEIRLSGDMVLPEEDLRRLIQAQPGEQFSRKRITQSTELMSYLLGQQGYAFARIDPLPQVDKENQEVAVNLYVDPGKRVYVRRINFNGASGVNDEVFRREMRQLEGGYLSNVGLERSEQRIRRLPFVESVALETVPVAGTDDLVDVELQIEEGLPGQFGGGIGFSGSQGLLLNGNFTHTNFMGTGNRVAAEINIGRFSDVYSINYSNPYRTPDGKSLGFGLGYRDTTQFISGASDFSTETLNASLEWGIPISEFGRFRYGVSYQDADLLTSQFSATQAQQFVQTNGDSFTFTGDVTDEFDDLFGSSFKTFEVFAGWVRDTRNRVIFATSGARHSFSVSAAIPGSEVEYYTARYDLTKYFPLWGRWAVKLRSELAFGQAINDTTDLPPFKNFFGGGPDSVRGFENGHLGPVDSNDNPYGGNIKTLAQLELLLPTPEQFGNNTRLGLFYDIGNVFYSGDTAFCASGDVGSRCNLDIDGDGLIDAREVDYGFDVDQLRSSFGVSVEWLAPLGTFRFSYAFPINETNLDEVERFQFSVGQTF